MAAFRRFLLWFNPIWKFLGIGSNWRFVCYVDASDFDTELVISFASTARTDERGFFCIETSAFHVIEYVHYADIVSEEGEIRYSTAIDVPDGEQLFVSWVDGDLVRRLGTDVITVQTPPVLTLGGV